MLENWRRRRSRLPRNELGQALVGFVMVLPLVLLVMLALLGLAMSLHARMILLDSAAEGARAGSLAGAGTQLAEEHTRELIVGALPSEYADDVRATEVETGGAAVIRVEVAAPLPMVGWAGTIEVAADAPIE